MERKYEIDFNDYSFMNEEGTFEGIIDSKTTARRITLLSM